MTTEAIDKIVTATAKRFGIRTTAILGTERHKTIAMARHVAMYLSRETLASFPEIGRAFNRDHSTVICAYRKIDTLVRQNDLVIVGHVEASRRLAAIDVNVPGLRATFAEQLADVTRTA